VAEHINWANNCRKDYLDDQNPREAFSYLKMESHCHIGRISDQHDAYHSFYQIIFNILVNFDFVILLIDCTHQNDSKIKADAHSKVHFHLFLFV